MTPAQFLLILWARRWLVVIPFVLALVGGTVVTLLTPKQYTATVSLVVDVKADPILGNLMPSAASPTYIQTQTEIIQSDRVGTRVVKLLRLEQNKAAIDRWKEDTNGSVPFDYYYGTLLQKALAIKPPRGSNIIGINYSGQDPKFAAAVANAFAQAVIEVSIDMRVEPARQYAAFFDERLKGLRANLEKAQAKLSAFQQEKGIVATDQRLDQELTRLGALTSQLSEIQGQKVEVNSRQRNSGSELSPDVQQNPTIISLKGSLNAAEARLSEISATVGKNHPQRMQLEAQIEELKSQMRDEIRRISGTTDTMSRATSQKEAELKTLLEAQKQKVLALRSQHDEISVLVQDVETAGRAYESVAQRMTQTTLESKAEQTNLSVLSPAMPPTEPSKPNVLKNIFTAAVGGIVAGFLLALGLELMDRRVRNADDLAVDEAVPLLGVLAPPKRQLTVRQRLALGWRLIRASRKGAVPAAQTVGARS
ncbi:MAG: chain length determinant protein EpsF [Betaproteobacteria bacterium]